MTTYECGCQNDVDESGILKCVSKCPSHIGEQRSPESLDRGYFESLGTVQDGIPQCSKYIRELKSALDEVSIRLKETTPRDVLEVGPGMSMYAPLFLSMGCKYRAVEPSRWAAQWTRSAYDVEVVCCNIENAPLVKEYDLIFGAHVFEHLKESPRQITRMFSLLNPGGELVLVLPDDSDPVNPDHLWFYTADSLRQWLHATGFADVRITTRRIVEREEFIYCYARKGHEV